MTTKTTQRSVPVRSPLPVSGETKRGALEAAQSELAPWEICALSPARPLQTITDWVFNKASNSLSPVLYMRLCFKPYYGRYRYPRTWTTSYFHENPSCISATWTKWSSVSLG